jgi:hypothetical protein
VHDLYFEPKYEELRPRAIWSFSNTFTAAFKELEPIPQSKDGAAQVVGVVGALGAACGRKAALKRVGRLGGECGLFECSVHGRILSRARRVCN